MLKGVFLRLLKICPVLWPAPLSESLQASSDHLSHFLLHLGLPLLPQLSSNNARGYSRHWPFGFARFQCHLFFSLLCEAFLLSPRLSLCPFASKCNALYVSKGLVRWSLGSGLDCGQWNSRRKSLGNSRDFPEARLPLLGPPPYFEGWNWKEWVLYPVRCFLFNLER